MRPIIILLLAFSLFCLGDSALLGAKECTYGPSYWCASLKNAKECNSVTHCIQSVWEKEILPEDNDDVCMVCKEMIKQARDQLLSNETQEDLREVFERSCKLIPIDLVRDECIKLSDDFIPELIEALASQMNPQVVCATAGLCNSARVDRLIEKFGFKKTQNAVEVKKDSPRDCQDCKSFIADIVDKVKITPRSQVLNRVLAICGRLGSFSDGCMSIVQTNFNFIYDFLRNGLHPNEFCDVFGMCQRFHGNELITAPRTEDEPCDFCVAIINSWRNNFLSNTTKEQFKEILNGLCAHAGDFQSECLSLVDQYYEVLYDLLVSEIHPKEICSVVGLCGPNAIYKTDAPIWILSPQNMLPLKSSLTFTGLDEANSYKNKNSFTGMDEANSYKTHKEPHLPKVILSKPEITIVNLGENGLLTNSKKPHVMKSNRCVMCEFVLHFLQNALVDKETRDEIKAEMDQVCTYFPHHLNEECQDYVDAYGDQLLQLLALEIDPSQVCPMIHLCPAVSMFESMTDDNTCILCEYVMTELDTVIADKKNEAAVKKAVESVCQALPKSIRPECVSFIDMYVDQIVDLLVNDFTPKQVCVQLGLCPRSLEAPIDPNSAQLPVSRLFIPTDLAVQQEESTFVTRQSNGCILCEFIISKIDSLIVSDSSEAVIRKAVDRVCLLLPHTLNNDCLGFMEEYSNTLIELLVKQLDPLLICKDLKLCKSHLFMEGMLKAEVKMMKSEVSNPIDECLVCEEVVDFFSDELKAGKLLIHVVTLTITQICNLMDEEPKEKCVDFVQTYGELIAKLIDELIEPKRVCQALKLCPTTQDIHLLGAKKCTWGPGYWCQSKLHAESCKAIDHCTEKVWLGFVPAV